MKFTNGKIALAPENEYSILVEHDVAQSPSTKRNPSGIDSLFVLALSAIENMTLNTLLCHQTEAAQRPLESICEEQFRELQPNLKGNRTPEIANSKINGRRSVKG